MGRACIRESFGVQIMLWGGLWLVQAPCVPHGLGTQKGGVEQIRINKSKKGLLFTHQRRIRRGVQQVWAVWPVGSAVCNSARMEAAQGATCNATAVGVVGANLLGLLNWAPKHVTCPDHVLSKCVTIQI